MTPNPAPQTLAGKTALVTGSTSGIGLESAKELLRRGAAVVFTGLLNNKDARESFEAELEQLKATYGENKIAFLEADLTQPSKPQELVEIAQKLGKGHIDVLVHSAGMQRAKPLFHKDPSQVVQMKDMDDVYAVNARAGIDVILAARNYMRGDGSSPAQITILSSVHGHVGSPERGPYCTSKFALEGFMQANAAEFAANGIRINSVCPAFVATPLAVEPLKTMAAEDLRKQGVNEPSEEQLASAYKAREEWRLQHQNGEWIKMEDVVGCVARLADFSNAAKAGESILLDNGYVQKTRGEGAAYFDGGKLAAVVGAFNERCAEIAATLQPSPEIEKPTATLKGKGGYLDPWGNNLKPSVGGRAT